ncbi:MAG: pitrilysin family protein, partial [Cyclobacteriaceae bacterium]
MKQYLAIIITLLTVVSFADAQVDRSKLPKPAQAREIEIGDYESFTLKNGLKVFVIEDTKLPRISYNLILDREPILEKDKVGMLSMAGQLMTRGTKNRTKEQLDEEVDFIGARLNASSASVSASGLSKYKEKILSLMADVILNPTFPVEELEKIRTQQISNLASSKENPDAISGNVTPILLYGKDHPYGEIQTEETTKNVTVADIKNYHKTYFKPNIAYLAIIGDIKKKEAEKLVKEYLGSWEKGTVPEPKYEQPKNPDKVTVGLVDRSSSVQSVIKVTSLADLKPQDEDVIPVRIMNTILGSGGSARLFMNLREDKGYTYGAYSSIGPDKLVARFNAGASVRNEVTDSAIVEFMNEIRTIRNEPVTDEELELAINTISGSFGRSLETPGTIAGFAINSEIDGLADDYYANYLKKVQAVTKEDIQRVAKKYLKPDNLYITVVGKASDIGDKLKKFGEVRYFDLDGNEYDPTKEKLPEGVTAATVIENYIKALGGRNAIDEISSVKMLMTANAMGNNLEKTQIKTRGGKFYSSVMMGGNVMMEQKMDGEQMSVVTKGAVVPLDPRTRLKLKMQSYFVPAMEY